MTTNRLYLKNKLIYLAAFYSSFRNANLYLFQGLDSPASILLDYLSLGLNIFILILIGLERIYKREHQISGKDLIVIILIIWVIIQSGLNSIYSNEVILPRILITSLTSFLVVTLGIDNEEVFNRALWAFIFGALFSAIIPLIKFPELIGSRRSHYEGVYFPGGIWNQVLISFMSSGWLILALSRKYKHDKFIVNFSIISFLLFWITSFAGLSRTFIVSTILSVFVYIILSKKLSNVLRFIFLSIITFLIINILMPEVVAGITARFFENSGDITEEIRITIWQSYLDNLSHYFFHGTLGDYYRFSPGGKAHGPHSAFLNWLVQYGIIGLLCYITILFSVIKNAVSVKKYDIQQYAFLVAWFVGYIALASINETGFAHPSFYVGLAFVSIWWKQL